MPSLLNTRVNQ